MLAQFQHRPVLLDEALAHLEVEAGDVIVDGTLGGGGHAQAILERSAPDGVLIGLDVDERALGAAAERLRSFGERAIVVHSSFRDLATVLEAKGIDAVDGVLLDLGVSSPQLDEPERGFRFGGDNPEETPLDMRMDPSSGTTAAQLLRRATQDELETCFRDGEVRGARRLARAIVEQRASTPYETAADLLRTIREAHIGGGRRHNPATLVFQALRIAVNDELGALREGLDAAVAALRPGGHLVVLSYHSLEDRIVKQLFRLEAKGCDCPPRMPVCICGRSVRLRVETRKPLMASEHEIHENPRARSVRLRAAVRVSAAA